jgi:hypothetical protein
LKGKEEKENYWIRREEVSLFLLESVLIQPANGAGKILGQILEGSAGLDAVVGIANSGIILIAARANILHGRILLNGIWSLSLAPRDLIHRGVGQSMSWGTVCTVIAPITLEFQEFSRFGVYGILVLLVSGTEFHLVHGNAILHVIFRP